MQDLVGLSFLFLAQFYITNHSFMHGVKKKNSHRLLSLSKPIYISTTILQIWRDNTTDSNYKKHFQIFFFSPAFGNAKSVTLNEHPKRSSTFKISIQGERNALHEHSKSQYLDREMQHFFFPNRQKDRLIRQRSVYTFTQRGEITDLHTTTGKKKNKKNPLQLRKTS